MLQLSGRALLREFVCDVVILLYKIGEALLDTTIRPHIIAAVCSDLYDHQPADRDSWPAWGGGGGGGGGERDGSRGAGTLAWNGGVEESQGAPRRHWMNGSAGSVCHRLSELPEVEDVVQRHAAGVLVGYRVLVNVPAVILGLFCGAWSDTHGRKLPMMAPSVGSCLAVLFYLTSTQVHGMKVALLLIGSAIQGIFGKTSVMAMAVNSHVSDTSDTERRTKRLGRVLASSFIGMFIGSLLAGVLQDVSSLLTILTVVSACHALCVLVILAGVTDYLPSDVSEDDRDFILSKTGDEDLSTSSLETSDDSAAAPDPDVGLCQCGNVSGCLCRAQGGRQDKKPQKRAGLFSWTGLRDSVLAVVRKREGNKRSVVVLCLVTLTLNQCLKVGDQDVTALFVQQPPLSWPNSRYGYLVAVDYGTMGLSLLLLLPVMSETFCMSDISIVMVAMVFKLVRALWAGFCTETWMVFTSVISGALGGLLNPGLRSVMSKTCSAGEVGKLFSMQASLETLSKFVGSSVFTGIYAASVYAFPATAYLVEAVVYVAMLGLFLWLGQLVQEDSVFGLLWTHNSGDKPYQAFDNDAKTKGDHAVSVYGTLPSIRTEYHDEKTSMVKTKNIFPLGASTP